MIIFYFFILRCLNKQDISTLTPNRFIALININAFDGYSENFVRIIPTISDNSNKNILQNGFEWLVKKIKIDWNVLSNRRMSEIKEWELEKEVEKKKRRARLKNGKYKNYMK
jgi:hypothetical protein